MIASTSNGTYEERDLIRLEENEYTHQQASNIEKLANKETADEGIYVLLKEILDNSIDEFRRGVGETIEIRLIEKHIEVRDYGRGIRLNRMIQALSFENMSIIEMLATRGARNSVELSGIAAKTVNALSTKFIAQSFRDGKSRRIEFSQGKILSDCDIFDCENEKTGTFISFEPDEALFVNSTYEEQHIERMLRHYACLNTGLTLKFNEKTFFSKNGLLDLLDETVNYSPLYPIVHLKGKNIEIAFTHTDQAGETYYSFVNGEKTTGGTHQAAFRKYLVRKIKKFYTKTLKKNAIRNGIVAAISINVEEPKFDTTKKTELDSREMSQKGVEIKTYIADFLRKELNNYLKREPSAAETIFNLILKSKKERKMITQN